MNVKGQGGDDEDDEENINDYLGVVFEDGGASEDAYYDIYDSDGWVDGGHANSDGFFISEDLDEILSLSDRIMVIYDGKLRMAETHDRETLGLMMAGEAA